MQKNSQDFSREEAAQQASMGEYSQAGQTLQTLLSTPEAQKLLKELGR